MNKEHKHKFINTGEYAGESSLVDYYWWKCVECTHKIKVDDFGLTFSGIKINIITGDEQGNN